MARSGTFGDPRAGRMVLPKPPKGGRGPGRILDLTRPAPGRVRLISFERGWQFDARLGEGSPVVVDGYGGWASEERPKRSPLTIWEGRPAVRVALPVVIDNLREGRTKPVEQAMRMLEKMAGLISGDAHPPKLAALTAGVMPHDYGQAPHVRWVIESLEWDDVIRNRHGKPLRAVASLVLMQHVADHHLEGLTASQRRARRRRAEKAAAERRPDTHRVTEGESLRDVARKYRLSDAELRTMKKKNDVRDADKTLKTGRKIKLP